VWLLLPRRGHGDCLQYWKVLHSFLPWVPPFPPSFDLCHPFEKAFLAGQARPLTPCALNLTYHCPQHHPAPPTLSCSLLGLSVQQDKCSPVIGRKTPAMHFTLVSRSFDLVRLYSPTPQKAWGHSIGEQGHVSQKAAVCWVPVAHICNPSYSRGRDQEDHGSRPAGVNGFQDPHLQNNQRKMDWRCGLSGRAPA
jgi:hypothetical protein